jgi:hypothetical protein
MLRIFSLMMVYALATNVCAQEPTFSLNTRSDGNALLVGLNHCDDRVIGQSNRILFDCGFTRGYLSGTWDFFASRHHEDMPRTVIGGQIFDVVRLYLQNHPGERSEGSVELIEAAFRDARGKK